MTSIRNAIEVFAAEQLLLPIEKRMLRFKCKCSLAITYVQNCGRWKIQTRSGASFLCLPHHNRHTRGRYKVPKLLTGRMVQFNAPHLFRHPRP